MSLDLVKINTILRNTDLPLREVNNNVIFPLYNSDGGIRANYIVHLCRPIIMTYGVELTDLDLAGKPNLLVEKLKRKLKAFNACYNKFNILDGGDLGRENPNACPLCHKE